MSSGTGESWSTSDDNSSGNEYSVKTKQDKLQEVEQHKQKKRSKKSKRKKRKKEKKSKKNKKHKVGGDSDGDSEMNNKKDSKQKTSKHINKNNELIKNGRVRKGPCTPPPLPRERSPDRSGFKKITKEERVANMSTRSRSRSTSPSDKNQSKQMNTRYKPSQYRSRSRTKSKSRGRSHSKDRKNSRPFTRSRSRSRNRSRSRGRYQNTRYTRISPSRDRSYQNYNRSYNQRYSERSRSRDRRARRSRSGSRSRKRSRSRSRGKGVNRSKTRSRSRGKRSRSKSYEKSKNKSPPPKKEAKSDTPPKPKSANWDVKHVPDDKTNNVSSTNNDTETKPPPVPPTVNDKDNNGDAKSKIYGKWETYVPPPVKSNRDLSKFTKMCQEISAKEGVEEVGRPDAEAKEEPAVHHPFAVQQAPFYTPQNFPDSKKPPPMNPAQAIMAGSLVSLMAPGINASGGGMNCVSNPPLTGPLEKHFPVSSGTEHRKISDNTENTNAVVFEEKEGEPINVSGVIARRLGAQQILSANPGDQSAKLVMAECDEKLKTWSTHNKKPGKFTGEVGIKMNKKEIFTVGGPGTAIQKDFFHNLRPVTGGIGMKMLQNMGWKEGQPLGKNMQGFVTPIAVDVKVGRAGLSTQDETQYPQYQQGNNRAAPRPMPVKSIPIPIQNINGKHPVSALAETCTKRKMGIPEYSLVMDAGHSYAKTFLMKVLVENVTYQPTESSPNKKHAKALAATMALKHLGLITDCGQSIVQ